MSESDYEADVRWFCIAFSWRNVQSLFLYNLDLRLLKTAVKTFGQLCRLLVWPSDTPNVKEISFIFESFIWFFSNVVSLVSSIALIDASY